MPAMTPKQLRFVEEYLLDANATQAAIRAGYSSKTANEQGAQLLGKVHVRQAIDAAKLERSEKLKIDAAWMLRRLVDEAEADLADLYDADNNLKPVEAWPAIWRQGLVAGVEVEALFDGFGKDRKEIGYVKKLRLSDRVRRLELIGKHISVNAFQEQVKATGLDGWADRVARAKARNLEDRLARVQASDTPSPAHTEPAPTVQTAACPVPAAPPSPPPPPPQAPPSAPAPRAPADWDAPARPYSPILPWPERPAFADCDYENFEGGLVGSRKI